MSQISVLLFYDGTWSLCSEGTWRYQRQRTKIIRIKRNCTLAELKDVVYNALNLDSTQHQIIFKFIYHVCLPCEPCVVENDEDLQSFIEEYSSHRPQDRSPLIVDVLSRVPQSINSAGCVVNSIPTSSGFMTVAPLSEVPATAACTSDADMQSPAIELHEPEVQPRISENEICENDVQTVEHDHDNECFDINDLNEYRGHDYDNDEQIEVEVNTDLSEDGLHDICWTQHSGLSAGDSQHGDSPHGNSPIGNVNDDVVASPHIENHLDIRVDCTASMVGHRVNRHFSSVNDHEIIRMNQLFPSKNELQKKLSLYALRRNFEFKVKKSDRVRYEVVCVNDNCMWRLRATKLHGENTEAFMIRAFKDDHICSLNIMKRDHRQATSSVIGDIVQPMFDGISRQYKPLDIVHDIRSNYGVNISYNKAWAAKEAALSGLWGTPEESYAKLPLWSHILKSNNPGTLTRIETDDENRFLYFFMALGASIRGFEHMRRVVAVDGTTLKNRYRGLLYIASCLDGNNQIYPLAYGIGPGETDAAYTWFFERFKEAFGDDPNIAFISDRHKSIAKAIQTVFPNNHHGHCTYHLGTNLRAKKFKGNVNAIISSFNDAARAYIVEDYDKAMQLLEGVSSQVVQYLKDANPEKWARSHFPGNRYNVMTTNIAESMNSVLLDARDKPILPLLDHIRDVLQKWWYERRNNAAAMQTPVSNWLATIMQERSNNGRGLRVIPLNLYEFQVVGHGVLVGVVNLENKTCSCKEFDIDGFPCVHAIAACKHRHISPYTLCSVHYSVESLREAYSETIYPLGDRYQWHAPAEVRNQVVLPPKIGKQSGRPRKKRIPSQGEELLQYRCGRCKQIGHSRRSCSAAVPLDSTTNQQHDSSAGRH